MNPSSAPITGMAEALAAVLLVAVAVSLRPLRCIGPAGPAWVWVGTWAAMPVLWSLDRLLANPIVPVMSLAPLSVLLAGWPLTVVMMAPMALLAGLAGHLEPFEAVHRLLWLGLAPATLTLLLGAASRRWLPRHLFIYILVRGFFAIIVALALAGAAALAVAPTVWPASGLARGDQWLGTLLAAFGEATISGLVVAALVAFRPHHLSTYTDRLYLPR
ncbi:hypothetical protein [Rhizobacter fulvus]|jgi:uncharacterized membrane protein